MEKGSGAKMKPSGIGGMAVMEGVMMKNKDKYAVAVRKPDNEIAVEINAHKDFSDKVKLFKLPVFRGMLAFVDSMIIGVKVLNYSTSFFDEEDEQASNKNKGNKQSNEDDDFIVEEVAAPRSGQDKIASEKTNDFRKSDKLNGLLMILAVLISIAMSVALFMVLPVLLTNFITQFIENRYTILFIEGLVRLAIFIGYVLLASRMNEIKRVFMYHGAEHKTINCLENGFELTVENVRWQSRQHKRCGTSFMLFVILISLVFFMFMPVDRLIFKILSRIILIPFIAGVSYEIIRLAGKSENKLVQVLSQPGLWMQGLTTKEPDDAMIEVAIQSFSAVFDWKEFLKTSTDNQRKKPASKGKNAKQSSQKQSSSKPSGANQTSTKKAEVKQSVTKQVTDAKQLDVNLVADMNTKLNKQPIESKQAAKSSEKKSRIEVKPQVGGLAYTGKVESDKKISATPQRANKSQVDDISDKQREDHHNTIVRNKGMTEVNFKPDVRVIDDDEDDEILMALDKFFDDKKSK